MASTLLLDTSTWDLVLDAYGDIAVASEPYSLAQDAASAIKTFLGECFFDTTAGMPWLQILGVGPPPVALLKAQLVDVAETVPDVAQAKVFLQSFAGRNISGQVQVVQRSTGLTSAPVPFSVVNPQGAD